MESSPGDGRVEGGVSEGFGGEVWVVKLWRCRMLGPSGVANGPDFKLVQGIDISWRR